MESGLLLVCLISLLDFQVVRSFNANFYTMAMQSGLSAGIINPLSEDMMRSYYSFCALMNYDEIVRNILNSMEVRKCKAVTPATKAEMTLKTAIEKGLKEEAHHITAELVKR